jgi:hypothetical protein
MSKTKLALVAAAAVIAFASPALAKTARHSQNDGVRQQQIYDSAVVPLAASRGDNPYYAPYANSNAGPSFPVGGFH